MVVVVKKTTTIKRQRQPSLRRSQETFVAPCGRFFGLLFTSNVGCIARDEANGNKRGSKKSERWVVVFFALADSTGL